MRPVSLLPLALLACSPKAPPDLLYTPPPHFEAFAFLVGSWAVSDADGVTGERWVDAGDDGLKGTGRVCSPEGECSDEAMAILATQAGVVFRAQPAGAEPVDFALVDSGPGRAVFANPRHDYPRRIRYEAAGATLVATIDDGAGQGAMRWEYTRVAE